MAKISSIPFLFLLTLSFSLGGCSLDDNPDNKEKDPPIDDRQANPNILLTEMNTGLTYANRAVEISNIGEEDVKLDDYSLEIYRNWSDESTESISLNGYTLLAHSTFVIAYSGASQEIKDKAQLVTDQYLNNGTFPVSINFLGKPIDAIGSIGYSYDFADGMPLLRLKEHFTQSVEFHEEHWIRYPVNTIDTLGNTDVISEETLLNGPKLSQSDFDKPFCESASNGCGGAHKVTLSWTSDGDTSGFNYGSKYVAYEVSGSLSTRYYGINTPEIAHSAGEVSDPYGDEAKYFTNGLLNKAKSIAIQSVNGYSIHETYGRMLGYVWISEKANAEPEDYQLLNYLIVKNGFSKPAFIDRKATYNSLMTYEGVSFVEYLYFANTYAEINKLNIHSGN